MGRSRLRLISPAALDYLHTIFHCNEWSSLFLVKHEQIRSQTYLHLLNGKKLFWGAQFISAVRRTVFSILAAPSTLKDRSQLPAG